MGHAHPPRPQKDASLQGYSPGIGDYFAAGEKNLRFAQVNARRPVR